MRAIVPSSGAWRSASAVTVPRPLKRCESPPFRPALEPPSKAISPPSTRALAPLTMKPRCEKSTRPLAAAEERRVGRHADVVAGQREAALDDRLAGRDSGTLSPSLSSAAPVADAAASALPVQRPTGVTSTKRSMSASGPRAVPSMSRRGAAAELGDAALHAAPLDVADLRPRGADVERRAIDDELARRRGERRPRLARAPAPRRARPTPARPARRRRSRPRPWRRCGSRRRARPSASWNGKSQRSPRTRKVALAIVPSRTAPAT